MGIEKKLTLDLESFEAYIQMLPLGSVIDHFCLHFFIGEMEIKDTDEKEKEKHMV